MIFMAVVFAIIILIFMSLLFTYWEYLFYKEFDERFEDYSFLMYIKERGIF